MRHRIHLTFSYILFIVLNKSVNASSSGSNLHPSSECQEADHQVDPNTLPFDDFFIGVEDEFKKTFPKVSRGYKLDAEPGPFFNHMSDCAEGRPRTSRSSAKSSVQDQVESSSSAMKRPKKVQEEGSKRITPYTLELVEEIPTLPIVSSASKDYGCPDPRWPIKLPGYDVYNVAHRVYKLYANREDVSVDTKFHTRCNEAAARDLLSRDEHLIKQAVRWIQDDYLPPAHTQELSRMLGESLMWSIVYDIAGRHAWEVDDVSKALAKVVDRNMAALVKVGPRKQRQAQMQQIEDLVCEQLQPHM